MVDRSGRALRLGEGVNSSWFKRWALFACVNLVPWAIVGILDQPDVRYGSGAALFLVVFGLVFWLIAAALIALLRSFTRLWVTLAVAEGVAFVATVYNGEGKSVVVLVAALTRSLDAALRVLVRPRPS